MSLDAYTIGNNFPATADITTETDKLVKLFRGRPLDFVTVPVDIFADDTKCSSVLEQLSNLKQTHSTTKIGIEVTNRTLQDSLPDQVTSWLDAAHHKKSCEMVMFAANSFTRKGSICILEWCTQQGIPSIAADILRAHPLSPGALLDPSVHTTTMSTDRLPLLPMEEAIAQLKICFDACIRIERTFLEKVCWLGFWLGWGVKSLGMCIC